MKIINYIIAICILLIGLILTYDKIEIIEIGTVKEKSIVEEDKIIDKNVIIEVDEETYENTTTLTDNVISTKKEKNSNTKSTTNKDTKTKTDSKKVEITSNQKTEDTKTNSIKEETNKKEEKPKEEVKKEEQKPKCSDFYESITHGKVDKSSKSTCVSYGNKIQNNELDEALDYNEENGNTRKPTISYFRCYEVVDSNCNTKGWYLHFFCNSGGCDDDKLKSLYG